MQKLTINDFKKMPWKNGQGVTYEIFRDKGDSLDDFGYRISMADVASDGPFSLFTGKQRLLSVIHGAGIKLTIDSQPPHTVKTYDVIAFDGSNQVDSTLLDTAIRDLNVMFDPQKYNARLQWLNVSQTLESDADEIFVLSISDGTLVTMNDETVHLSQYECLVIARNQGRQTITVNTGETCALIEIIDKASV